MYTLNFENSRERMATLLNIVKSPYLNEKSSDFNEIWHTTAHLELDDSQMTKYEHFYNSI